MQLRTARQGWELFALGLLQRIWVQVGIVAAVCLVAGFVLAQDISLLNIAAGLAGLGMVAVAYYRPEYAAALLLVINYGNLHDVLIRYHGVPSLVKPLVALLVVVLVGQRFLGRPRRALVSDPVMWWLLAYVLTTATGLWFARNTGATQKMLEDLIKDVVIAGLIFNLLATRIAFERAIWGLLALGLVFGSLTAYQEATSSFDNNYWGLAQVRVSQVSLGEEDRARAAGPIGDPNFYGQLMVVLVPMAMWAAIHGRTWRGKLFGLVALLAILAGIGLSFSRGAYLGAVVVIVLYALYIKLDPRYLLLLPLIGVMMSVAPPEFRERFSTLEQLIPGQEEPGAQQDASIEGRSVKAIVAFNMLADNILLGVGRGNYRYHYQDYLGELGGSVANTQRDSHSLYLEVASEQGIIGIFVFGGMMMAVWSRFRRARKLFVRQGDTRMAGLTSAVQVGFAGYLGTSIFLHGAYLFYLWLLVGMAVALVVIAQGGPRIEDEPAREQPAAPALAV